MSLSTLKPVAGQIPPVIGGNGSHSGVSKVGMVNRQALPPLQVKEKEKPLLRESFTVASRREMMHLSAASLGLLSLLLPASAEASTRNANIRQKIMEKLEELRQKAGLSKPKGEGAEKKSKTEGEEKKSKDEVEDNKSKLKSDTGGEKKSKAEGEEKKSKDEDKKSKLKNDTEEEKPKLKAGVEEKNPGTTPQRSTVPPKEEPSVPALPNILNGKTAESTLP